MTERVNILVGLNHGVAFDRRAFVGIATLANERGNVRLFERLSKVPWERAVRDRGIHGLIVGRNYEPDRAQLNALGIPFVSLADVANIADNEYVVAVDDQAVGAAAARHFLDAGYQQCAVAWPGAFRSFRTRIGSFIDDIHAAERVCVVGPPISPERAKVYESFDDETSWSADAGPWLAELPKPVAVFAPNDYHARVVVNVAQEAGLRVPDDVAVLGVNDDDVYCMSTQPQLSSVITPGRQIGTLALETLLRVIRGEDGVQRRTLLPPPGVAMRGSSSSFALQDPDVIAAVRYIRENVGKRFTVNHVASHVLVSRRTLERRFISTLSHTIQEEMRRTKLHRAKQLLADTDLPYADVARRCGFAHQQQLNRAIKVATSQTPAQYRRTARAHRAS